MRLLQFSVENFRSILNTDWVPFSSDNITALVGQNESGKSSIIDALVLGFGDADLAIDEDDFRRPKSSKLPVISLAITLSDEEVKEIAETQSQELRGGLEKWLHKKKSRIAVQLRIVRKAQGYSRVFDLEDNLRNELNECISDVIETVNKRNENIDAVNPLAFDKKKFNEELWRQIPELVVFKEEHCTLPNKIDILERRLEETSEKIGAKNFLVSAGLSVDELIDADDRELGSILSEANKRITAELQKYWSQLLGKTRKIELECELKHYSSTDGSKAGNPYLVFWVTEASEKLYPSQRSRGTRWFISFFLQLIAEQKEYPGSIVWLLDEPATFLHPAAQKDVLHLIEKLAEETCVIYSTHSPYMLDQKKLHRVLAVEREEAGEGSLGAVTIVRRGLELATASQFTLAPILSLIGVDLSQQNIIKKSRNVILEENSAYYYLDALRILMGRGTDMHFIPGNGADSVALLVDLFIAWGIEFTVLVDDDPHGKNVCRKVKAKYFFDNEVAKKRLQNITGCEGIEDLFSKADFLKLICSKKGDSKNKNSEIVKILKLSKPMLAVEFWNRVRSGEITSADIDGQTKAKAVSVFEALERSFV